MLFKHCVCYRKSVCLSVDPSVCLSVTFLINAKIAELHVHVHIIQEDTDIAVYAL